MFAGARPKMTLSPSDGLYTASLWLTSRDCSIGCASRCASKHSRLRTEQASLDWIRRFILFHEKKHPSAMGATEIEPFLNHLALERQVAASTQNQALSALLFLYREGLGQDFGWLDDLKRAKKPAPLPVVLSPAEVRTLLAHLEGRHWLMASLLYGAGLRLMECVRLRVKDVDFGHRQIAM